MLSSPQTNEVLAAIARARKKFGAIVADQTNPHFRSTYEDLNGILGAIRGPLAAEGVEIIQPTVTKGKARQPWLQTRLVHYQSGQWIGAEMPLTGRGNGPAGPQDLAAAITYQRRYTLKSLLSLEVNEDDDGNTAQAPYRRDNREPVRDRDRDQADDYPQDRRSDRGSYPPPRRPNGGGGGIWGWAKDRSKDTGADVVRFLDAYGKRKGFPAKLTEWPEEAVRAGKDAAERWLDGSDEGGRE